MNYSLLIRIHYQKDEIHKNLSNKIGGLEVGSQYNVRACIITAFYFDTCDV